MAHGAIIFADDFEAYADRAAMLAPGAWGDWTATPAATADLILSGGTPDTRFIPARAPAGTRFRARLQRGAIIWEFDFAMAQQNSA